MGESGKRYARKDTFTLRAVADEAVLIPGEGSQEGQDFVYAINEVGAAIWRLIEPTRSVDDIGRCIAEEFDVGVEKATEDVCVFLTVLAEKGLIYEI